MLIDNPDGSQVLAQRTLNAPVARLWKAFTEPADMARWMWGSYTENCVAEVDLRVGGRYSVYTDSKATEHGWHADRVGRLGIYIEIIPEQKLVYSLHWDAPVGYNQQGGVVVDETMIVSFSADGEGTMVEVRHLGIPDNDGAAIEHGRGLGEELETLATIIYQSPRRGESTAATESLG